ncbi:sporulation protein YjcZ [Paenibacillus sp. N3/727]|nr:sporulation protein YjcZ [Paenibacillus sp. N3/727]UNK17015.1 sporulation protein YjcZ [Paenibacillus sp. N3/727]
MGEVIGGCGCGGGLVGGFDGFGRGIGFILVLFILLVIVSCHCGFI